MVVADAMNCQKETTKVVIEGKGDYLLSVKTYHSISMKDIEEYVQNEQLCATMQTHQQIEKGHGRIEKHTAFVTTDIAWLHEKKEWKNLCCIGAIHAGFEKDGEKTSQWHCYISSRELTPIELL